MPTNTPAQQRTRVVALVGAASSILNNTDDPTEETAIWDQTVALGLEPDDLVHLRNGRMSGAWNRRDAKVFAQMLQARRQDGKGLSPQRYLEGMTLLVTMNNDVPGARRIWESYRADGRNWSERDKQAARYDENVRLGPAIPDESIKP